MEKIENYELNNIIGGEASVLVYVVAAAIVVFLAGVIEGYVHPRSCGEKL